MRCGRPEGSCHVEWRQVDPSTGSSGHAGSESWYLLKKQKSNQKYKQNLRNLQAKLIKKEMQGKDCSGWIRQTGLNEGSDKNWQTKGRNYHWTNGTWRNRTGGRTWSQDGIRMAGRSSTNCAGLTETNAGQVWGNEPAGQTYRGTGGTHRAGSNQIVNDKTNKWIHAIFFYTQK